MNLRIKELRANKNWTQDDLAKQLKDIDRSMLSKIEKGKRKLSVDEAVEIASIFEVSVDYLLGVTDRTLAEEKRMIAMFNAINDVENKLL
jgi:transcriptional regulator with XRE-family HTH domain